MNDAQPAHEPPTDRKPRLIIVGGGFAGYSLLKQLRMQDWDVTVVSRHNHFLFTPLLPGTTVGTVEFRSIIEPLRVARRGLRFYHADCSAVDTERRTIDCHAHAGGDRFELAYDKLVIAVGAVSATYGIPGVEEHALFIKDLSDARRIRMAIIEAFERAAIPDVTKQERERLLDFIVVGGGPTGVEVAAHLHDFVTGDLKRVYPDLVPEVRIRLVEAIGQVLSAFDSSLSEYVARHFKRQRIEVRTHSQVARVEADHIEIEDGTRLPCGMVVWSTGNGPNPLVRSLQWPKTRRGQLLTDKRLRVQGFENVYALGDCADIDGRPLAATAQVAMQQGKYLGRAFRDEARGRDVEPFHYHHMGMLAYVGNARALADLNQVRSHGFLTYLFWRSAYLTRLVSIRNKILVLFDWLKTTLFGRDISHF